MRVAAHHPVGHHAAGARRQRSVSASGRDALRNAGNPRTWPPSVTGMPSPVLGGHPPCAAIVTKMDDACNLWWLFAQPLASPSVIADAPRASCIPRAHGIAARRTAGAGVKRDTRAGGKDQTWVFPPALPSPSLACRPGT